MFDYAVKVEALARLISSEDEIDCPHCGHKHQLSDPDICSQVVSYWGDDLHDFTCWNCNADFMVREQVIRKFETFKSDDEDES